MKKIISFCLLFVSLSSFGQDIEYARRIIYTLSSATLAGRGYVKDGDKKASEFIAGQFSRYNLGRFGGNYFQPYSFPMNTFPGNMRLMINKNQLNPGEQFITWVCSPAMTGKYKVETLSKKIMSDPKSLRKFEAKKHKSRLVLVDKTGIDDKKIIAYTDSLKTTNFIHARGFLFTIDKKPVWSVSAGAIQHDYVSMEVIKEFIPKKVSTVCVDIESNFVPQHKTQNVIGFVRGWIAPDTFLVFTAHYDHLGWMGNQTRFPGANDNASGTAMVLDLARHYARSDSHPYYSMVFILLSGKEAGLKGSYYFCGHPLFPLKNIKMLVNLDMVGTGSEGISMVNGTIFKSAFDRMLSINKEKNYVPDIRAGGEGCNSDHCPFYQRGVPSVFVFTRGNEFTEYHNPRDISATLPLTRYTDVFRLMRDFMDSFSKESTQKN